MTPHFFGDSCSPWHSTTRKMQQIIHVYGTLSARTKHRHVKQNVTKPRHRAIQGHRMLFVPKFQFSTEGGRQDDNGVRLGCILIINNSRKRDAVIMAGAVVNRAKMMFTHETFTPRPHASHVKSLMSLPSYTYQVGTF